MGLLPPSPLGVPSEDIEALQAESEGKKHSRTKPIL